MEKNNKRYKEKTIKNTDRRPGYLYYKMLTKPQDNDDDFPSLEELKMDYIQYLLEITGQDIDETAGILAIHPSLLHKELKKKGSPAYFKNKEKDSLP